MGQRRLQDGGHITNRSTRPPKQGLISASARLGLVLLVKLVYNRGVFAGGVMSHAGIILIAALRVRRVSSPVIWLNSTEPVLK